MISTPWGILRGSSNFGTRHLFLQLRGVDSKTSLPDLWGLELLSAASGGAGIPGMWAENAGAAEGAGRAEVALLPAAIMGLN